MRLRLTNEHRDGGVIEDVAGVVDNAVLAVHGVRVKSHVSNDEQVGILGFDCSHGRLYETLRVGALGAVQTLLVAVDHRKQGDSRDAQGYSLLKLFEQAVNALARNPRHRRYRLTAILAVQNEHRIDQVA